VSLTFGVVGGIIYLFNLDVGFKTLNRSLEFGCRAIGYFKALTVKQGMLYDKVDGE
jgi:hypothetical protein